MDLTCSTGTLGGDDTWEVQEKGKVKRAQKEREGKQVWKEVSSKEVMFSFTALEAEIGKPFMEGTEQVQPGGRRLFNIHI